MTIQNIPFNYICRIALQCDENGAPIEYRPQLRYKKRTNSKLNPYGHGEFCKFRLPKGTHKGAGVYLIMVKNEIKYIGECKDLVDRFNWGYGSIQPKNCYEGGQPTNCRINKLIFNEHKAKEPVELYFFETTKRAAIESALIKKIRPVWNK